MFSQAAATAFVDRVMNQRQKALLRSSWLQWRLTAHFGKVSGLTRWLTLQQALLSPCTAAHL
jgi:Tfp pilus assembly protein PilF